MFWTLHIERWTLWTDSAAFSSVFIVDFKQVMFTGKAGAAISKSREDFLNAASLWKGLPSHPHHRRGTVNK